MESWILVVWIVATNMVSDPRGVAATSVEFSSASTCNAAAEAIKGANGGKHSVYTVCAKK